jgi:quercetin dioxygenase-like cupin family protein
MEIVSLPPTTKGPTTMFAGDVWFDVVAPPQPDASMLKVKIVRFAPGAHTAWHSHAHGQTLHVTEGVGYAQSRGGDVVKILPGQTIWTPPGEEHWHGATPDHFMSHLAMWEGPAETDGPETTWGDHLTDDEYPAS